MLSFYKNLVQFLFSNAGVKVNAGVFTRRDGRLSILRSHFSLLGAFQVHLTSLDDLSFIPLRKPDSNVAKYVFPFFHLMTVKQSRHSSFSFPAIDGDPHRQSPKQSLTPDPVL